MSDQSRMRYKQPFYTMTPTDRIIFVERLANFLQTIEGCEVDVAESITSDLSRGHDRHCATFSSFRFSVERVGWNVSGGALRISGTKDTQYCISSSALWQVEISHGKAIVAERHGDCAERRSTITSIDKSGYLTCMLARWRQLQRRTRSLEPPT